MRNEVCSRESTFEGKEGRKGWGNRFSLLYCGRPGLGRRDSIAARATTLLLRRLVPNLAPLVDGDGRGNSDDGT
jgi:hypothetical protein